MGKPVLTLEHVAIAAVVAIGVATTAGPIADNSMLTHLRTGMDIARDGEIPRSDPYSFTAAGEPWVVQSWFAALTYGLAEMAGGAKLVILEQMVLTGLIAFVMAVLCRAGSMARTVAALSFPIVIGYMTWAQRPLLFGVLAFALLVLIVDKRYSPWWLLPVGWVWVNTHGSFVLGFAYLVLMLAGTWLDNRKVDRADSRYLGFFGAAVLLGALNPLGPKLLVFWTVAIGDRQEAFGQFVEWLSPNFHSGSGAVQAIAIVLPIAFAVRARVPWRYLLPAVAFLILGLYSFRHLTMYAVVICPLLRVAFSAKGEPASSSVSQRVVTAAFACIVLLGALMVTRVATTDPYDFESFPVAAVDWIENNQLRTADHHVIHRETTGNYLEHRYGRDARVFVDDRVDMYPAKVFDDYLHLLRMDEDPLPILQRYNADVVLWERKKPLAQFLSQNQGWAKGFEDDDWVVFVKR